MVRQYMVDKDERDAAILNFNAYDYDGGGTISRREFNELLKSVGVLLTKRQLSEVVDLLAQEQSGSGHIHREEFIEWWIAQGKHLVAAAEHKSRPKSVSEAVVGAGEEGLQHHRQYDFRRDRSGAKSSRKTRRIEDELLASARAHAVEKRSAQMEARIRMRAEELDRKLAQQASSASMNVCIGLLENNVKRRHERDRAWIPPP
jgi:hypothetical protein